MQDLPWRALLPPVLLVVLMVHVAFGSSFQEGGLGLDSGSACLSESTRQEIQEEIGRNIARLTGEAALAPPGSESSKAGSLIFPLQAAQGFTDYGFHYTLSFVDHDHAFGSRRDFDCGNRTADGSTVGWHRGTDYNIWPFHWNKMDAGEVEVVAARSGVVVARTDGLDDRSCPGNGLNSAGNAIYVRHTDSSVAWYVHMKKNSVTNRFVGQPVTQGEYLGVVGSSGSSVSPHLHFELRDKNSNVIDPYSGPCNILNASSWWIDQPPYYDPSVLRVSTHMAPVSWGICPEPDRTFESTQFEPGANVWYYVFGRDGRQGDQFSYNVFDPDGEILYGWFRQITSGYRSSFFHSTQKVIPENAKPGQYRLEVLFMGETFESYFNVGIKVPLLIRSTDARSTSDGVLIRWDVSSDRISGFRLRRGGSGGYSEILAGPHELLPHMSSWLDRGALVGESYVYTLSVMLDDGSEVAAAPMEITLPSVETALQQSHPNPFNPSTTISFSLADRKRARVEVYDLSGRQIVRLHDGVLPAGHHSLEWDGRDERGGRVSSGTYIYRLHTASASLSRKFVLLE